MIDHYEFEAGIDSIPKKDLDSLLNGNIVGLHNDKPIMVKSYIVSVIYSDGRRANVYCKAQTLSGNSALMVLIGGKDIIYLGIWSIDLRNERRKIFHIYEGYGWKFY